MHLVHLSKHQWMLKYYFLKHENPSFNSSIMQVIKKSTFPQIWVVYKNSKSKGKRSNNQQKLNGNDVTLSTSYIYVIIIKGKEIIIN